MKKVLCVTLITICLLYVSIVSASILSDPIFDTVDTTLGSTKTAYFQAETFDKHDISVTAVKLYIKNSDNTWSFVKNLTPPSYVAEYSRYYNSNKNYSSHIGSGTYKLYVTYNADGHTISRYSNTQTY